MAEASHEIVCISSDDEASRTEDLVKDDCVEVLESEEELASKNVDLEASIIDNLPTYNFTLLYMITGCFYYNFTINVYTILHFHFNITSTVTVVTRRQSIKKKNNS